MPERTYLGTGPKSKILLESGFTVVETFVTIFVFTLIMGAVASFITLAYRTQGYIWEQSVAVDEARRGVEIMVKEIRQAQAGEDGSYPIEKAEDKQIVFYSDINNDNKTEKVRYFLGNLNSGTLIQECQTASGGGNCTVNFSNFLSGTLISAQVKVSVDGDLDSSNEYVSISADGTTLINNLCQTGCLHCAGAWQGISIFDVMSYVQDDSVQFRAQASFRVGRECPIVSPTYSMKARFELSWTEEIIGAGNELKKGVIYPAGVPAEYPPDQENISIITSYVRNAPPIFEYFDANGDKILDNPSRLIDTKVMEIFLVVNVDPDRPPNEFELESSVQLRNLKEE